MKKLLLLIAFAFLGCSQDDDCHTCNAKFYNEAQKSYITYEADCNHTPPGEGYIFVECSKE